MRNYTRNVNNQQQQHHLKYLLLSLLRPQPLHHHHLLSCMFAEVVLLFLLSQDPLDVELLHHQQLGQPNGNGDTNAAKECPL